MPRRNALASCLMAEIQRNNVGLGFNVLYRLPQPLTGQLGLLFDYISLSCPSLAALSVFLQWSLLAFSAPELG